MQPGTDQEEKLVLICEQAQQGWAPLGVHLEQKFGNNKGLSKPTSLPRTARLQAHRKIALFLTYRQGIADGGLEAGKQSVRGNKLKKCGAGGGPAPDGDKAHGRETCVTMALEQMV